jgi:hypothetical protein
MNRNEEPSVLDYVKARLMPWRGPAPEIPPLEGSGQVDDSSEVSQKLPPSLADEQEPLPIAPETPHVVDLSITGAPAAVQPAWQALAEDHLEEEAAAQAPAGLPWRALLAAGLALMAQFSLEPGAGRSYGPGVFLYALAAVFLTWAAWRREWRWLTPVEAEPLRDPLKVKSLTLLFGAALSLAAFAMLGQTPLAPEGNRFNLINVVVWLTGVMFVVRGFWLDAPQGRSWLARWRERVISPDWQHVLSGWGLVVLLVMGVVIFFRVYRLQQVPAEMVSDHAEKLLDVWDVLHGETRIFFPRNTGREALQFYLTAAIIQLFNTGYSHLSLKIGTVLAGLLTLPYIYLLGKEIGGRRVALLALFLAGVAYWPNVISRVGLRFPFYPLFVAPTLYYLLRGLRTGRRNDFILSGAALGIGLHGYTPIRILPFVVVAAVGLYLLHRHSRGFRRQTVTFLVLLAVISLVIFLPLLRYALENPEGFAFRSFSRLGTMERPLPGDATSLFFHNLWRAVTMFAWDDGNIWVVSLTNRPALDIVSGAFFYLGVMVLFIRYLRRRHWLDLFLLLSVPLLQMPSILSLAFPDENPALNRMGGAYIPVFLIAALALDGLMRALENAWKGSSSRRFAWAIVSTLLLATAWLNYDLVFNQYATMFRQNSWNTSEMGAVIRDFANTIGSPDSAYVVAFPHWVDTRLVAMNAGFPLKDYAIFPENIAQTSSVPAPKLFLLRPDDEVGLQTLYLVYPNGVQTVYESQVENHDFYLFYVLPEQ